MISKPRSNRKLQQDWHRKGLLKGIVIVGTSDVKSWGVDNYSNRAERDARDMVREGLLRRLMKEELILRNIKTRQGYFERLPTLLT